MISRDLRAGFRRWGFGFALLPAVMGLVFARVADGQGVTLTLATHYTDDQRTPLTACLRTYEQIHPGTNIVHRQLSYRDVLQTLFMSRMSGKPPDIYHLSTVWTKQLVDSGALASPPRDITDFVGKSYLSNTIDAIVTRGQVWGIPSEVDVYMLVYNKRLFAKAGLTHPPATWDELVSDAGKIAKENRQGQLTTSGFAVGPSQNQTVGPFLTLLYSYGHPLFAADGKSTNLGTAAARRALEDEVRLFQTRGTNWGYTPYQFPSGAIGMMIVPNWFQKQLHQGLESRFDETVGVAPIPGGQAWRTVQYGFFWSVDASSQHPAEAWALLKWLNTAKAPGGRSCVGDMMMEMGALTGNKADLAASESELKNPFMQPFVDALSSGRALPQASVPHANEIEALLSNYIERALLGVITAEQALRESDARILMILQEKE